MFEDDVLVRDLCEQISLEKDEKKAAELLAVLRSFMDQESFSARLRIRQVILHYSQMVPSIAELMHSHTMRKAG
jgi:hypothetical protein